MVFKCPKCSYKTASYKAMQRHYSNNHSKATKVLPKGKQKKVYTYKPPKLGKSKRK